MSTDQNFHQWITELSPYFWCFLHPSAGHQKGRSASAPRTAVVQATKIKQLRQGISMRCASGGEAGQTRTLAALAEGVDEAAGASGAVVRPALADIVAGRAELALAVAGAALVVPSLQIVHPTHQVTSCSAAKGLRQMQPGTSRSTTQWLRSSA